MSFQRRILVYGILLLMAYFGWKEFVFYQKGGATVTAFQLLQKPDALEVMSMWGDGKIEEVKWQTRVDYVFLVLYSCLLAAMSAERMNLEHNPVWNNLLRLSILLSFIAGFVDLMENIVTTHNLNYREWFQYAGWLTLTKFALVTWVLLLLAVTWIRRRIYLSATRDILA